VDVLKLVANSPEMRAIRWKEIGMVFQEPMTSFSPLFTIGNQITEALRLHIPNMTKREMRDRVIELLGKVGIPQPSRLIDVYPHQLSGGMRQRAMIAMALSCNPKLLIADEPTTALDVTIEAQILELIRSLQEEFGMALMYISHDLAVVSEMSDEIMVMYLGRIMEKASTDDIFHNPKHPYTQALWRSIPAIEGETKRLNTISGMLPNPYTVHKGCPFFSRCEHRMPGLCDEARPAMTKISETHTVSCFLYDKDALETHPTVAATQSVA
ncbi:MAG TPA: ABC transporter ATP-binding protein, partial [Anaerolineae bacterium]